MKNAAFLQSIYKQSAVQMEELDTIWPNMDGSGRYFAYAQAGAADLAVGKLNTSVAPSANANDETLAASAVVGATSLSVTFGGAVTADFYKDGYIWANDDTGEGTLYRVKGHAAGTTAVTVYLKDPVRIAMTAGATTISAIANRQSGIIIGGAPGSIVAPAAGVNIIAVTAYNYFWHQVKGPCVVLGSGTLVIGDPVYPLTTAGAVGPMANTGILDPVGTCMSVNATTEYSLINLAISGY